MALMLARVLQPCFIRGTIRRTDEAVVVDTEVDRLKGNFTKDWVELLGPANPSDVEKDATLPPMEKPVLPEPTKGRHEKK